MDAQEVTAFLDEVFPEATQFCVIEDVGERTATVRVPFQPTLLRPGGTISGPTLMTLADTAMYVAVLSAIGREALAVTTSLTINFLRKPPPADVIGKAKLLKLGRTLAVGEIHIFSANDLETPVAHASCTYAIPPAS